MAQKTQKFDELNNFFGDMPISDAEKKQRVDLASAITDIFIYLFYLIDEKLKKHEYVDEVDLITIAEIRFSDLLDTYEVGFNKYLEKYPHELAKSVVGVTMKHIQPVETLENGDIVQEIDTPYFLSNDRALTIGKNEANTVFNAISLQDAIDSGYTTKTWVTMEDELVRDTHVLVDGKTIPIDALFDVGMSQMPFPRSPMGEANETVNCRCTLKYGYYLVDVEPTEKKMVVSGARITDPESEEGKKFAQTYYESIRHMTTDCDRISKNTGFSKEQITRIKKYLFIDYSYYNVDEEEWQQFEPDCAIAQSWQRLMLNDNIKKHDITLLQHEIYEMEIKKENPSIDHLEAHRMASMKYNYSQEAEEYYDSLE